MRTRLLRPAAARGLASCPGEIDETGDPRRFDRNPPGATIPHRNRRRDLTVVVTLSDLLYTGAACVYLLALVAGGAAYGDRMTAGSRTAVLESES
jgi:hypothetical protein